MTKSVYPLQRRPNTWLGRRALASVPVGNPNLHGARVVVFEWQDGTGEVEIRAISGDGRTPAFTVYSEETIFHPSAAELDSAIRRADGLLPQRNKKPMTCLELYPSSTIRATVDLATLYRKVRRYGADWLNVDGNILTVRYGKQAGYHQSVWASAAVLESTVSSPLRRAFKGMTPRRAALPLLTTLPTTEEAIYGLRASAIYQAVTAQKQLAMSEDDGFLFLYRVKEPQNRNGYNLITCGRVLRFSGNASDAEALYNRFSRYAPITL